MQPALPPSVCLVTAARPYLPGARARGEGSSLSVGGRPSTAPESPPGERGGKKRGSQSAPKPSRAEAAGGSLAEPPMA